MDKGAPCGPGSHAAHEAPNGLRPAGFDPSRYTVGQRLWFVPSRGYGTQTWVEVTSVGRKWVNLLTDSGREIGRVLKGSDRLDGGEYRSPGTLYASPEHFDETISLNKMWDRFRQMVTSQYPRPRHLGASAMIKMMDMLRDSDRSGEAVETTGSTEGESAGREASPETDQETPHA